MLAAIRIARFLPSSTRKFTGFAFVSPFLPAAASVGTASNSCMPYVTGEHPEVGDRVCDRRRRYGTVTHVIMWGSERSELVIKWEDRTIGIRYTIHEDFELLGRKIDQEVVLPVQ